MAINLSNVNITIQQFQAVASGVINAGEVRLTSDHSIDKVNHHVGWFFSNNTHLSHAEVLAIKDAFVRALSQSGVSADAIAGIRRDLGLAPIGAKDATLAMRSLKPLSRQEIREILDQHAREINATVGQGTIRTDEELHARYTQQQRDEYAQTRRAVNAALAQSRQVVFDRAIGDVQSIIAGDVHFRTPAERDRLIAAAERMKALILERSPNGVPSTEPGATMKFGRQYDGFNVTFALGGSAAEVLKRIDDMLLALRYSAQSKAVDTNPVQPDMPALAPTLSPVEYKKAMREGANGDDAKLTHEMKTMRSEVLSELRTRFGADIVPQNASFSAFVFDSVFSDAFGDVENGGQRRTYDEMKARLLEGASREAARRFMVGALKPMLQAAGVQADKNSAVASALLQRHPQIRNRIAAAASPEAARAAIEEFRQQIDACIRRQASIDRYRGASADWYREALANELHIPVSSLAGRAINTTRLSTTTLRLADDIGIGANPADTDQQIEQAFRAHVASAVAERVTMLRKIEQLQVFGDVRDIMIETVLMANKVGDFDLAALKNVADAIPVGNLVVALDTGTNDEIFTQMGIVARAARDAAKNAVGAHDGMVEEVGTAGKLALVMALSKRPEVFNLMRDFFLRPDIQDFNPTSLFHLTDLEDVKGNANVFFEMFRLDEPVAESNAALADQLDKPGVPPIVARALYQALDSLGFDDLRMEEKAKLLSGYDGKKLAQQVRKSTQAVTPYQLQALVRMQFVQQAAHHAVIRRVAEVARQNGIDPTGLDGFSADVAFGRDRNLRGNLVAAIANAANSGKNVAEAVKGLLAQQDAVLLAALRSFDEIRRVNATAWTTVVNGISDQAGIDRNVVETYLNADGLLLEGGGALNFLRGDVKDKLVKPETDISAWDAAAVRRQAEERVQSFIEKKAGFIAAIYNLEVSDSTRGALMVETLEQRSYTDRDLPDAAKTILERAEIRAAFQFAKAVLVPDKVEKSTTEEIFSVLQEVSARLNDAVEAVLPEEKRLKMDNDDYAVLKDILNAAFVDFCGDTLLAAAARLVAADRFAAIDEVGIAAHQRYNNAYMDALSVINEAGEVVPDEPAARAASKNAAAAALGRRLFGAISNALNDEWLPLAEANAVRKATATPEQKARAAAVVKRAPALFDRHSAGMDAGQRAELKAFIIALDLRDDMLEASDEMIRAKATEIKLVGGFDVQGSASARTAISLGYVASELAMLERVADLYCKATGCTMVEARAAALDNASPARRLYAYGGRFTASVENFRAGLALLGTFKNWFAATNAALDPLRVHNPVIPEGASLTVLNASTAYFREDAEYAYEKFIFEHLAIDESIPLAAEDPETIFGMEHNPVTRFVGRAYVTSCVNTFAQVPPEKRVVLFAVFDLLAPLPRTAADLYVNNHGQLNLEIVARVLAHFDEIDEMRRNGTLTKESFCNRFLTDIPGAAGMTIKQMADAVTTRLDDDIRPGQLNGDYQAMMSISFMMQNCGCTIEEAVAAILAKKTLPSAPYVAEANGGIAELRNDASGGRTQMVMDLERPNNATYIKSRQLVLKPEENVFTVAFPDGTKLKSASTAEAKVIADKVAAFCGSVHPVQLNAVFFALTQASSASVVGAFAAQDIHNTEHMPLTYTLAKDAETGVVTIRYSEPAGFPVKFHWETTIGLDGVAHSNQMVIE